MSLLRRHAVWLVLATLAGVAGAWLISASMPVRYTSTASVDIESHAVAATTPIPPNLATEKLVATSGIVLSTTARQLGVSTVTLATDLGASVAGTSNILSIGCTMPTAVAAQRCAATAAAAYVSLRNMLKDPIKERAADPLRATLVTAASRPLEPSKIKKRILVPIGAILGLLLGLGAVVLRDALDGRVRDQADLEKCLGAPVLTAVPQIRGRSADPEFVFSQAPLSRAAEAYRYLRARLDPLLTSTPDRGTVVLVASAQPRDGRTSVATNLATAMAQAGATVLLVDADLRRPAIGELFGIGEEPGLTDLLARTASLDDAAVHTNVPRLRVVTIGRPVGQPAEIFDTTRLARVFSAMRAAADVIVVDSGPVLSVSDAIAVAGVSDVVAIVGDVRRTKRSALSVAVTEIRAMDPGTIVGVVNRVPGPLLPGAARPSVTHERPLSPSASLTAKLARMAPQSGNGLKRSSLSSPRSSRHGRSEEEDPS